MAVIVELTSLGCMQLTAVHILTTVKDFASFFVVGWPSDTAVFT